MNCEDAAYKVSCELQNVTHAIGQPTGWEIAGVIVAAVAALATLFIGWMNIKLLRRQSKLDQSRHAQEDRDKRFDFAQDLIAESMVRMSRTPGTKVHGTKERSEAVMSLTSTALRQKFLNGPDLTSWALKKSASIDIESDDIFDVMEMIGKAALLWADSPDTFTEILKAEKADEGLTQAPAPQHETSSS